MSDTPPGSPSAGEMLRSAREKQGLHIAALAAAIKVSPRKLDALENDRWHELPDATFTRALAQTVCRSLKLDPRPVLALLPATGDLALEPASNVMNQPFRDRPGRDMPGLGSAAIRPMVWAAAVLMAAAIAVYLLPADLWTLQGAVPAAAGTQLGGAASSAATAPAVAPSGQTILANPGARSQPDAAGLSAVGAGRPASAAAGTPPPAGLAVVAPASTAAATVATATPSVLPPASSGGETVSGAPPAAPAPGLVQISSSEPSWVDVRDGRGVVLLSRTVLPGESVGLNGSLPIRLTIGNASGTQIRFRGEPVDLLTRTRENVARVELQ